MIATITFKGGPWDGIVHPNAHVPEVASGGSINMYTRLTGVEKVKWDDQVWQHRYSHYSLFHTPDPTLIEACYLTSDYSLHSHFMELRKCKCMEPVF